MISDGTAFGRSGEDRLPLSALGRTDGIEAPDRRRPSANFRAGRYPSTTAKVISWIAQEALGHFDCVSALTRSDQHAESALSCSPRKAS